MQYYPYTKKKLAYIEPHKILINNITYLFFNECNDIYINTLENSIPFNEFKTYIKTNKKSLELDNKSKEVKEIINDLKTNTN